MPEGLKRCMRDAVLNPAWICFTWFGMTAGVSILSTLARFAAPSMTRPVAIDVGRVTFAALNKAELVALLLLLIVIRVSGRAAQWWAVGGVLALIVIAQSAWLLPELSSRAAMVTAGVEPPASYVHGAYSVLELLKLGILFVTGFVALAREK
ncbi:MAG: hypothetical protein R3358_03310 [Woeseiaceae bacterium]|nr:hypothetical protein [Woeseiaceae bacterium]